MDTQAIHLKLGYLKRHVESREMDILESLKADHFGEGYVVGGYEMPESETQTSPVGNAAAAPTAEGATSPPPLMPRPRRPSAPAIAVPSPVSTAARSARQEPLQSLPAEAASLDLLLLVDCTPSMAPVINAINQHLGDILNLVMDYSSGMPYRVAFVGYRDFDASERYTVYDFMPYPSLAVKLLEVQTEVGQNPDTCGKFWSGFYHLMGDVLGGMFHCSKLSWKSQHRLILQFADAPGHGARFHNWSYENCDHWRLTPPPEHPSDAAESYINALCELNVNTMFYQLGKPVWTNQMLDVFSRIYKSYGHAEFFQVIPMCEIRGRAVEELFFACVLETLANRLRELGIPV
ncbi:hypothetical protein HDU67_008845 [Dinochytrium kinnereticum]|nr:hypothetical protein HDU67_008845 [Dinochytrium kinnereticum]